MADVLEGNSGSAVAEPEATGQTVSADSGTPNQNGQAASQAQSAPGEDSFSSIDPNTLPPELQAIYKNLQSDYTKKTQSIADVRKKAEAYDGLSKDKRFVSYWKGLSSSQKADFKDQKAQAEQRLGEKISDDEFAKAFNSKEDFLSFMERLIQDRSERSQKKIETLEEKLSVKEAADVVDSFATEIGKDGKPVRPDFYTLDEDRLITGFLQVNPPSGRSNEDYVEKLNEAYAWAKATTQKYYEKGKAEALQTIQKKVANSSEPPTHAAKGAHIGGKNPKDYTVRESIEMAKRGERVPQDYD